MTTAPAFVRYKRRPLLALSMAFALGTTSGLATFALMPAPTQPVAPPPYYESTGKIHVRPWISPLLSDQGKDWRTMYESYVTDQIGYMTTDICLNYALASPTWKASGRQEVTLEEFSRNLTVAHAGEFILITYRDLNGNAAKAGVKAVIDAYQLVTKRINEIQGHERDIPAPLEDNRNTLEAAQLKAGFANHVEILSTGDEPKLKQEPAPPPPALASRLQLPTYAAGGTFLATLLLSLTLIRKRVT